MHDGILLVSVHGQAADTGVRKLRVQVKLGVINLMLPICAAWDLVESVLSVDLLM